MVTLKVVTVILLVSVCYGGHQRSYYYHRHTSFNFGDRFYKQTGKDDTRYEVPKDAYVNEYYLACDDVEWEFAPLKENTFNNDMSIAKKFMYPGKARMGSKFKKAVYKQYTDNTYEREIPKPDWLGMVGPLLKCEVNEKIVIHLKNKASIPCTIHAYPNVFYKDTSEGALINDGTPNEEKPDDKLEPGQSYTYTWECRADFGPLPDDESCITVPYHSHFKEPKDIHSGLVGMAVVCRPGTLEKHGKRKRKDGARECIYYMDQTREADSQYFEHNIQNCGNPDLCKSLFKTGNKQFIDSTVMHQGNGYIFGNGPDMKVCVGDKVVFYTFSLNLGFHSFFINGQALKWNGGTYETLSFQPGTSRAIEVYPENEGRFVMGSRNPYGFQRGLFSFLNVEKCKHIAAKPSKPSGIKRVVYLAATEVKESTVPDGIVTRVGRLTKNRKKIEKAYLKVGKRKHGRFVAYKDKYFKKKSEIPEHRINLGPHVYAEVGDVIEFHLKNKMKHRPASINPIGLDIMKENEGVLYRSNRDDDRLSGKITYPGETNVYTFMVPESHAILTKLDKRCYTTHYFSSAESFGDGTSLGLTGPMTICNRGGMSETGVPIGYDKQFFLRAGASSSDCDLSTKQHNRYSRYSTKGLTFANINGYQFGNVKGLEMCLGERVLFTLTGFACHDDGYQSFIFEGNNVEYNGEHTDGVTMGNGQTITVSMTPDSLGKWHIKSGMTHYQEEGMVAVYNVIDCGNVASVPPKTLLPSGTVRRYYIAAQKIKWQYVNQNTHPVTLVDLRDPDTDGHLFVTDDKKYIGTKFYKAVYREYKDKSFRKQVRRKSKDIHLGILGPMIRAEVGDTIEIVFKNKLKVPVTINLRNLVGSNKMAREQASRGVAPGRKATYRWHVSIRSGPTECEPNCVARSYESTTNPTADASTGLFGPLVICREGVLDKKNCRRDRQVTEFAINPSIYDERNSHYIKKNLKKYAPKRRDLEDPNFIKAMRRNALNGKSFFNTPALNMTVDDRVCWYVIGTGDTHSYHTVKFHGQPHVANTFCKHKHSSVVSVTAGTYKTVCFDADHAGIWKIDNQDGANKFAGSMAVFSIAERDWSDK